MRLTAQKQVWYWGGALAILFLMLWSVGNAVLPFILGAAAAYLLDPVADRLERLGLSRTLAVVVITIAAILIAVMVSLTATGLVLARLGHSRVWATLLRSVLIGLTSLGLSYLVGSMIG